MAFQAGRQKTAPANGARLTTLSGAAPAPDGGKGRRVTPVSTRIEPMHERLSFISELGLGEFSEVERRLCDAFLRGDALDLRTGDPEKDDPERGAEWGEERRVRAEVIVALLLSAVKPDPGRVAMLSLTGARVTGELSLAHAEVTAPLFLQECRFDEPICLDEAAVRSVHLAGSTIPRLDANDAEIKGHLNLDRCRVQTVALTDVHITGQLSLNGARLTNPENDALNADRLVVEGSMFCREGFQAEGEVRLLGARIAGQLDFSGARLTNPENEALNADRLVVEGSMFCGEGFQAEGEIRLLGARVAGQLSFNGARLTNPDKDVLSADGLVVEGNMFCRNGFQTEGEIRLLGARVASQLSLDGARLTNPKGNVLNADQLVIQGSMFCRNGFQTKGEIRLLGARVTGQLDFSGAHLTNPKGNALDADGLVVEGNMFFQDGFQAEGVIRLLEARVAGQLGFNGARLTNPDGLALCCMDAEAASLWLAEDFAADGDVDLSGMRVRTLFDDPECWPAGMYVNELVYNDLEPDLPAMERLRWLRAGGKEYRAQPYEQLAAYYRRQGHDEEARRVLLAKQRHHRASRPWYARIWGYLLDGMVGYGYRPGRAALWVLGLWAAGSVFFTYHQPQPIKAGEHPAYQPVLYTADVLLPIINLGQESAFTHQGLAQWVASVLIVLGWMFATALVAGVTRVLTRN
ncbi:hypothetical protein ACI2LC_11125 [Nonomuraea wenchangensis]|uniref:hypothetical protein n=1 Tax=Nonomuraea wenchangensis TaxID=568860 RepID=UPI00385126E1